MWVGIVIAPLPHPTGYAWPPVPWPFLPMLRMNVPVCENSTMRELPWSATHSGAADGLPIWSASTSYGAPMPLPVPSGSGLETVPM